MASVGSHPGTKAAADGRRVELGPVRVGWVAAAFEGGGASAMRLVLVSAALSVEAARVATVVGTGRGMRRRSS